MADKIIFNYTCSARVKVSQKVLRGYFCNHTVDVRKSTRSALNYVA